MIGTDVARIAFADAVSALVGTLGEAQQVAGQPDREAHLRGLLHRARRQLDLADEKLLMLDRRRQRSMFRRAERLRERLDLLHHRLGWYHVERTFDDGSRPCPTDPQASQD